MFGPPGRLYVYLSYGIHRCANVVTGEPGDGQAVLLRAIVPMFGLDVIRARRGGRPDRDLDRWSGQALRSTRASISTTPGFDLTDPASPSGSSTTARHHPTTRSSDPRVGISKAVDTPWRFRAAFREQSSPPQLFTDVAGGGVSASGSRSRGGGTWPGAGRIVPRCASGRVTAP